MPAAQVLEMSPGDRPDLTFDFTDEMATAEKLTGVPTVAQVPNPPAASAIVFEGACTLDATGKLAIQQVSKGTAIAGERFTLKVTGTTDTNGAGGVPHIVERHFILEVRDL